MKNNTNSENSEKKIIGHLDPIVINEYVYIPKKLVEIKWHTQFQKPVFDEESTFSVFVLSYSPMQKTHSISRYDYELNKWHSENKSINNFIGTYLSYPIEYKKINKKLIS